MFAKVEMVDRGVDAPREDPVAAWAAWGQVAHLWAPAPVRGAGAPARIRRAFGGAAESGRLSKFHRPIDREQGANFSSICG